jgi:PadR family transcriptional regulator PadR
LQRIRQISGEVFDIPQGSLYPALYRLEHQALIAAEWGQSENNRRAKYYTLTTAGRRRLREETAGWNRLASGIASALNARPEEVWDVWAFSFLVSGPRASTWFRSDHILTGKISLPSKSYSDNIAPRCLYWEAGR